MFQQGNRFGGGYQSMDQSGGFMNNDFNSPTQASQERKQQSSKVQTLTPVTIALINQVSYDEQTDIFTLRDNSIHMITFVGVVKEITEATTNIMYKIDDMTGDSVTVRKWIDDNEREAMNMRSECREDSYVRVVGHLKALASNKPTVIGFSITPITDFNEVTYHLIDVVHAHLLMLKASGMNSASKGLPSPMGNTPFKGGMHMSGGDTSFGGGGGAELGLSRTQKMVHDAISVCNNDQGMGLRELRSMLRGISDSDIREAVEFLSNEGHIYSTIDDEHYKSTS